MEDAVLLLEADHQLPIIDFDLSSLVASYCFFFVTVFFFLTVVASYCYGILG